MGWKSAAVCVLGSAMLFMAGTSAAAAPQAAGTTAAGGLRVVDRGVPHTSTVPANAGQDVQIAVREIVQGEPGAAGSRQAVLFVHGASVSGVAAFDFDFDGYSWGRYLARAGFDVFIMDFTGYGFSPRPEMNNPCNTTAKTQTDLLVPNPLPASCAPTDPHALTTIESDRAEIDAVVDWIRAQRGVQKVDLIGWSLGGMRAGTYTSLHPDKVNRLVLYASCCYRADGPSGPPSVAPASGAPMQIQSWDRLVNDRWLVNSCKTNVDPDAPQAAWNQAMGLDPLGSTWGTPAWNPITSPHGGLMRYPSWTTWGWNLAAARRVVVPTLVIVGQKDGLYQTNQTLYQGLGASNKVFVGVACTTHFAVWERSHVAFQKASKEWLQDGAVEGVKSGQMTADTDGTFHRQ